MTVLLLFVLGCDIGLAQGHQIIYVITRIEQKAAYSRIGNLIIDNGHGAHMKVHQFLHISHLLVLGQFHTLENTRHHLLSYIIVVMESPAVSGLPPLGSGFAYIVQQRSPAQPKIIALAGNIVQHLKRMQEDILMAASVHCLHTLQSGQLGKDQFQQPAPVQINESL
ncbi:MAG: hypothetical protein BWY95_01637 [Bacteroidetes bacterium ADurb.BinA104]|nr:MAG: hypothetical protein BWY95_01637 [Bacteroidetes bacterium ADurb.BinA104]